MRSLAILLLPLLSGCIIVSSPTSEPVGTGNTCPVTEIEASEWTERDAREMEMARSGCVRHYPSSPCLIRFTKTGELSYYAICGRPR